MKLLKKYHDMSAPIKASLWFLICGFLQKGVAMITTPIFTRVLTPEQYGVYSVYLSWYSIVSIIAGLNLGAGVYTKGLVKNEDDQDVFSSSMMGLSLTTTLICVAVYYAFSGFFNSLLDMSTALMTAMFSTIILANAYIFWSNRERVSYKYKKLAVITVINAISTPIFGIVAVINSPENLKVEARVYSNLVVDILLFGWIFFSVFRKGKVFYHKEYWKYALAFNLPLVPHYLSQIVLSHSDRIMISSILGDDKAGLYSVAFSLAYIMQIFNSSVTSTMNPWIFKSLKAKQYKNIGKVCCTILAFLGVLNFALIAVGPELISIMAPKAYASGVWVIPPIAASVFFMFMYSMFATFEYYFEKTRFVMYASVISALINITLNYFFLNMFSGNENGFIAAGYTTLFCYICSATAHYLFMSYVNRCAIGKVKIYNIKIIIGIIAVFLLLSAGVTLLYPFPIIRFIIIALLAAAAIIFRKKIMAVLNQMKKD